MKTVNLLVGFVEKKKDGRSTQSKCSRGWLEDGEGECTSATCTSCPYLSSVVWRGEG